MFVKLDKTEECMYVQYIHSNNKNIRKILTWIWNRNLSLLRCTIALPKSEATTIVPLRFFPEPSLDFHFSNRREQPNSVSTVLLSSNFTFLKFLISKKILDFGKKRTNSWTKRLKGIRMRK